MFEKTFLKSGAVQCLVNQSSLNMDIDWPDCGRLLLLYDRPSASPVKHRLNLTVPESSLEILIVCFGQLQEHLQLDLEVHHLAPRTRCNAVFKALLYDHSSLDFRGNLKVPGQSQQSETFLRCDSLLLSPDAKSRTIPCLEIVANDVKAGHAASAGQPDEEKLFYLQTRGFSLQNAKKLLVESQLREALKTFSSFSENNRESVLESQLLSQLMGLLSMA